MTSTYLVIAQLSEDHVGPSTDGVAMQGCDGRGLVKLGLLYIHHIVDFRCMGVAPLHRFANNVFAFGCIFFVWELRHP
jgi:hypothetical protein